MKKTLIPLLMVALIAFMGSCVGDEIDNLQNQINDLNNKVDDLEKSQQEALLAEIAALQATIAQLQAAMEAGDSELADQYAALLNNLQLLEEEVANNASAVYYGNLLTDADFDAVLEQGATIVTGKAVPTKQNHIDAIAAIKMVGGDLILSSESTINLENLQNVGGNLSITGVNADATVTLPALASVGGYINIAENNALTSFMADAVILVYGQLSASDNDALQSISLASLDQVAGIDINGYNEAYYGAGTLNSVELSSANVNGDVAIQYLSGGALSFGNVGGNFMVDQTSITSLVFTGQTINGDFTFTSNSAIETMDVASLEVINGQIYMVSNGGGGGFGGWSTATADFSSVFPAFENLKEINGDVYLASNTTETLEAFNSVTTFTGSSITIDNNATVVNVFNKLESGGSSTWSPVNISASLSCEWFDSFTLLKKAGSVYLYLNPVVDPVTWEYGDILRIDGFGAMTEAKSIEINTPLVTSFSLFAYLDHISGWGTDLKVEMPEDTNVGFCSMGAFFTKYNSDPSQYAVEFNQGWGNTIDPADAINQLMAPCVF